MDGATRPLAGSCLRDKRAPVEAAIETEKQVIAPFCEWKHNGRPELEYLIQTRDRLAAQAEAPAPTTPWCVCPNLHYWTWTLVPTIYCFFYVVAAVAVNCIIISMGNTIL